MNNTFCTIKEIAEHFNISEKQVVDLLNKIGFVGLGTKADSEMQFSRFVIQMLKDELKSEDK